MGIGGSCNVLLNGILIWAAMQRCKLHKTAKLIVVTVIVQYEYKSTLMEHKWRGKPWNYETSGPIIMHSTLHVFLTAKY